MDNFQDQLETLVDKWIEEGDLPENMISDLQGEIERLRLVAKEHEEGEDDSA